MISCSDDINNNGEGIKEYIPVSGYVYDDKREIYINKDNGIWYIVKGDDNVIPSEEFILGDDIYSIGDFEIEKRPDSAWELSEIIEVRIRGGDSFYGIVEPYYDKYFRMNKEWYYDQVKKLNSLENIELLQWNDIFKIPKYTDNKQ